MINENAPTINLKDLLVYILRKWLYIVIVTLAFALILAGYRAYICNKAAETRYSEESKKLLVQHLTGAEAKEVENLFSRYIAYKNSISYSESYLEKSILMQMDPNRFHSLTVQYSIESDYNNLVSSFTSQTLGITEYKKIATVFGEDTDTTSISELVSIYGTPTEQNGVSVDVGNQNSFYIGNLNNIYKWIINLTAYAYSETQCEEVMQIVEDAFMVQYHKLIAAGIEINVVRVSSNYTENTSHWLADRQRSMISEASTLKSEYDSFEEKELSNLSPEEQDYFVFLKDSFEGKTEERHILRFTALGGVLGFIISLIAIVISYLFSSSIRNTADYVFRSGADDIIGVIYSQTRHVGFINRIVNKTINKTCLDIDGDYDSNENAQIIAKRIRNICNRANIKTIYIIDDSSKSTAISLLDFIVNELKQEHISVGRGKPLLISEDFDAFNKSEAVIYFGNLFDSKISRLSSYKKLFVENNITVLGSILHCEV
ncbi:MAG: hypothetical protein IKD87_08715 [Oscillospiraceae bacterium]|nr:hypothetical protein [Oscillospiraceae bacterium]